MELMAVVMFWILKQLIAIAAKEESVILNIALLSEICFKATPYTITNPIHATNSATHTRIPASLS